MTKTSPAAAKKATRPQREPKLRLEETKPPIETKPQVPARPPIIRVHNLEKTYHTARGTLTLFKGLNLEIEPGAMIAIVGQSGAGKSTLLTSSARSMPPPPEPSKMRPKPTSPALHPVTPQPFVIAKSVTSGSSTTSCPSSPPWKT